MKNKFLFLVLLISSSVTVFAQDDQISVNINGKVYACTGSGNSTSPQVVSTYCECTNFGGIYFNRVAIMSNGTSKKVSSTQLSPENGSYNPNEILTKCEAMVKQCK